MRPPVSAIPLMNTILVRIGMKLKEVFRSTFASVLAFVLLAVSTTAIVKFAFFGRQQPVETIDAEQLHQILKEQASLETHAAEEGEEKPSAEFVIVDVRSPDEQSVSMIPGAITDQQFETNRKQYEGRTVIAYCTIGVRSEHYARELIASGQHALNFKGSILGWCEANYPLVTPDGTPTQRVHTYSAAFKAPPPYLGEY